PALMHVQESVNGRLGAMASPGLRWDAESGRMALELVPRGLLGALWLQFALAVGGNKEFRQCGQCNTWFELSPETSRTNRLFCSGACRTRAHRLRQEQARAMRRQGKSIQ